LAVFASAVALVQKRRAAAVVKMTVVRMYALRKTARHRAYPRTWRLLHSVAFLIRPARLFEVGHWAYVF